RPPVEPQGDHAGLERDASDLARRRPAEDEATRVLRDGEQLVDAGPSPVAGSAALVAPGSPAEPRAARAGDAEGTEVGRRGRLGDTARGADAPDQPLGE